MRCVWYEVDEISLFLTIALCIYCYIALIVTCVQNFQTLKNKINSISSINSEIDHLYGQGKELVVRISVW